MGRGAVELELPQDWRRSHMPAALQAQLSSLLEDQDETGKLSMAEREEAQVLTKLVDLLSRMKLRAERTCCNR